MSDYNIKEVLMERDGMSESEADEAIEEMKEQIADGEDPDDVLHEIGLEPDYIWDLIK